MWDVSHDALRSQRVEMSGPRRALARSAGRDQIKVPNLKIVKPLQKNIHSEQSLTPLNFVVDDCTSLLMIALANLDHVSFITWSNLKLSRIHRAYLHSRRLLGALVLR
jgi:hypothetical protein